MVNAETISKDNSLAQSSNELDEELIVQIAKRLYATRKYAYICVDNKWGVIEASENLQDFGFSSLAIGTDATDQIDFLVGVDPTHDVELPMLSSPTRIPIRVSLLPNENYLTVVIADAQDEFQQQKQLQQKANENQLLLDQQRKLMAQLEVADLQLKVQNDELQEAARLQNSFISGVSHEFRTPLTSILGYTDLLAKSDLNVSDKSAVAYLASVRRSSKHLLSLIENLLDHGKFDSKKINLNPHTISVSELFDDVAVLFKPMALAKGIEFSTEHNFAPKLAVLIDDSRLRQCLINIISNAINYTDVGYVKLIAHWQNDTLEVEVTDTGIGVSLGDLKKIKQPFWQAPKTGKSGTGLGLTITERIVEMMGGSLCIESELDAGTTVSFDVMAPAIEFNLQSAGQPPSTPSKPLKILFAEDDEDIALLVTLMLEERGVTVSHVVNGALAVAQLSEEAFDLVLMDLQMPVLDGYGAVKTIRESGNEIPIVMMTASAMESDKSKASSLGCDGYLVKPVACEDLFAIANQLVV